MKRKVSRCVAGVKVEPPAQLLDLPKRKVAALVIDPGQLAEIRDATADGVADGRHRV